MHGRNFDCLYVCRRTASSTPVICTFQHKCNFIIEIQCFANIFQLCMHFDGKIYMLISIWLWKSHVRNSLYIICRLNSWHLVCIFYISIWYMMIVDRFIKYFMQTKSYLFVCIKYLMDLSTIIIYYKFTQNKDVNFMGVDCHKCKRFPYTSISWIQISVSMGYFNPNCSLTFYLSKSNEKS